MLVGEQPGDQEDLQGHPFVGPAGRILHEAMGLAGIAAADAYITNAVKHFKWTPRGSRRLHKKPSRSETLACLQWLEAEIDAVSPEVIVCLGSTAAQAMIERDFKIGVHHGELRRDPKGRYLVATIHPSFVLRQRDDDERRAAMALLVADLEIARRALRRQAS